MPIYACECADFMAETLGVSRLENSTVFLLVYKADSGWSVGFDCDSLGISLLWELVYSQFLLKRQDGNADQLFCRESCLSSLRWEMHPFALVLRQPNVSLRDALAQIRESKRKERLKALRARLTGVPPKSSWPCLLQDLLGDATEWSRECTDFVIRNSGGLMIWRFGAGEFGLHCIGAVAGSGIPLSAIASDWLGRAGESLQIVRSLEEMPMR